MNRCSVNIYLYVFRQPVKFLLVHLIDTGDYAYGWFLYAYFGGVLGGGGGLSYLVVCIMNKCYHFIFRISKLSCVFSIDG